jgi:hypothetical protein
MKTRTLAHAALLFALPVSTLAGDFQRTLQSEWLGAWVVVRGESYSDCNGQYTDNRIHGNLVQGKAAWRFTPGELAKLDKVDLKRSRLDLMLTFDEPMLVAYQDGPFTLYREAQCRVELEVEIPREAVKSKDDANVETLLMRVLERYATEQEARSSETWNERERDPYPEGYETTLAKHAVWKAEQTNAAVQAQLDHALDETTRITDRMVSDPAYASGFVQGVQAAKAVDLEACPVLLGVSLADVRRQAAEAKSREAGVAAAVVSGFQDGKALVYGLEMLRNLPACFVPVPEHREQVARQAAEEADPRPVPAVRR